MLSFTCCYSESGVIAYLSQTSVQYICSSNGHIQWYLYRNCSQGDFHTILKTWIFTHTMEIRVTAQFLSLLLDVNYSQKVFEEYISKMHSANKSSISLRIILISKPLLQRVMAINSIGTFFISLIYKISSAVICVHYLLCNTQMCAIWQNWCTTMFHSIATQNYEGTVQYLQC